MRGVVHFLGVILLIAFLGGCSFLGPPKKKLEVAAYISPFCSACYRSLHRVSPKEIQEFMAIQRTSFHWVPVALSDHECDLMTAKAILCADGLGQAAALIEFLMEIKTFDACTAASYWSYLDPKQASVTFDARQIEYCVKERGDALYAESVRLSDRLGVTYVPAYTIDGELHSMFNPANLMKDVLERKVPQPIQNADTSARNAE